MDPAMTAVEMLLRIKKEIETTERIITENKTKLRTLKTLLNILEP